MFKRSIRSLIRSPMKNILIVFLLVLSIGLAMIMLTVNSATQNQLDAVKTRVGNQIQVRPAGSFALLGGGEPISDNQVAKIAQMPHVVSIQKSAQAVYTGPSLESSIGVVRLGRRAAAVLGGGASSKLPVVMEGFEPSVKSPELLGNARIKIQDGRYFNADETDANVSVIGQALATKNNLSVGSKVNINGADLSIIGIFASGQAFGNGILITPFNTLVRLFDLSGATSVTVEADNAQNVSALAESISNILGTDNVDVVTSEDTYENISSSLASANQASQTGMIAAFIIAGAIVLFSVFISVRQRTKEIGIMKAIGASNFQVSLQFGLESLEISVIAAIIGSLITFPLTQQIGRLLIGSEIAPGAGAGAAVGRLISFAGMQLTVSPAVFLYALAVAVALAVLASILSTWYVGRVKPAEVLRNE